MIKAHFREVGIRVWLECEAILWLPGTVLAAKQNKVIVRLDQLECIVALDLHAALIQEHRLSERITKPDVGQPALLQIDEQRHMVERWIESSLVAGDAG